MPSPSDSLSEKISIQSKKGENASEVFLSTEKSFSADFMPGYEKAIFSISAPVLARLLEIDATLNESDKKIQIDSSQNGVNCLFPTFRYDNIGSVGLSGLSNEDKEEYYSFLEDSAALSVEITTGCLWRFEVEWGDDDSYRIWSYADPETLRQALTESQKKDSAGESEDNPINLDRIAESLSAQNQKTKSSSTASAC